MQLTLARGSALAAVALSLASLAPSASAAPPDASPTRPWLDAPLAFLLHTRAEFGVDAVLLLGIVGRLTGDSRATEVAGIRRLGLTDRQLARVAPLFALDLEPLATIEGRIEPISPPPLPPEPTPASRLTADGRLAVAATCVEPAAQCDLAPGCVEWALDPRRVSLELTHQAVWLLFVEWRSCAVPATLDLDALRLSLAGRLLGELRADGSFSEVHLERIATLGQLGAADRIDPDWVRSVLDARSPEGCWASRAGAPCSPHATVLALWALALAERAERWP